MPSNSLELIIVTALLFTNAFLVDQPSVDDIVDRYLAAIGG